MKIIKKNKEIILHSLMCSVGGLLAGCVLLAFFPHEGEHVVGIMPLFYILSIQWSVFRGTHGHNASTVFSTNNLYQLAHAASYAVMKKAHRSYFVRFTI